MEGCVVEVMCYRFLFCVECVKIFVDSYVKYGSYVIVVDCLIVELIWDFVFFDVDCVIVMGQWMGDSVSFDEIVEIGGVIYLLFLVGFGVNVFNIGVILQWMNGVIVVLLLKEGGVWWNFVDWECI